MPSLRNTTLADVPLCPVRYTCSLCGERGHNARGCLSRPPTETDRALADLLRTRLRDPSLRDRAFWGVPARAPVAVVRKAVREAYVALSRVLASPSGEAYADIYVAHLDFADTCMALPLCANVRSLGACLDPEDCVGWGCVRHTTRRPHRTGARALVLAAMIEHAAPVYTGRSLADALGLADARVIRHGLRALCDDPASGVRHIARGCYTPAR